MASPEFVGRSGELGVLASALDQATDGHATTVLVGGEAGVGKTRLVSEFCRRSASEHPGLLAATGVCVPSDGGALPYGPVAGLLRDIVRQLGDDAAGAILGPLALGLGWASDLDVDGGAFSGGRHTEDLARPGCSSRSSPPSRPLRS